MLRSAQATASNPLQSDIGGVSTTPEINFSNPAHAAMLFFLLVVGFLSVNRQRGGSLMTRTQPRSLRVRSTHKRQNQSPQCLRGSCVHVPFIRLHIKSMLVAFTR